MDSEAKQLSEYMRKNYPGGEYYSVYRSWFRGIQYNRELESYGIKNKIASPTEYRPVLREEYEEGHSRFKETCQGA